MDNYYRGQRDKQQHRNVKWSEFPRSGAWTPEKRTYLQERGIEYSVLNNIGTAYASREGICFILFGGERAQDRAYQERLLPAPTLDTGATLRWRNPAGVSLDRFVYCPWSLEDIHDERDCSRVYLVEGSTDALRLHLAGYIAIGLLGVSLTDGRCTVVRYLHNTLVSYNGSNDIPLRFIPDNDGPGEKLVGRITREFGCRVLRLPYNRKDVCDLTEDELKCILREQYN